MVLVDHPFSYPVLDSAIVGKANSLFLDSSHPVLSSMGSPHHHFSQATVSLLFESSSSPPPALRSVSPFPLRVFHLSMEPHVLPDPLRRVG